MKQKLIAGFLGLCVAMATASAADTTTTMVWTFDTPDNPSVVQPTENNPFGLSGSAAISVGAGVGYAQGTFSELIGFPGYGTATGIWDILNGGVTIDVELFPATPQALLDYTLTIGQFASPAPGFPYSPTVSFSIPGSQMVSQVTVETDTEGSWIETTYVWQDVAQSGPLTLALSSDPGRGLLLDSLTFSIVGDLVPIPEPSVAQLGMLAAFLFGIGAMRRPKSVS